MLCAKSVSTFRFWTFPYLRYDNWPRICVCPIVLDYDTSRTANLLSDNFPPSESPKDKFGDRECSHHKLSGNFTLFSKSSMTSASKTETAAWWWVNPATGGPVTNTWSYGVVRDINGTSYPWESMLIPWGENRVVTTPDCDWYRGGMLRTNQKWSASWSATQLTLSFTHYYNGVFYPEHYVYDIGPDRTLTSTHPSWTPIRLAGRSVVTIPDPARCNNLVQSRFGQVASYFPPESPYLWGDLTQVAIDDARELRINSSMYVYELFKLKSSITDTLRLLRGRMSVKKASKLFLAYRYGITLTVADTKKIVEAIQRHNQRSDDRGYSITRAMTRSIEQPTSPRLAGASMDRVYTLKVYYDPIDEGWQSFCRELFDWDFFPSLENAWDVIPFSFVLDWFVKVQDGLASVDVETYTSLLTVYKALKGFKTTVTNIPGDFLFQDVSESTVLGSGTLIDYYRVNQDHLDLPIPRFDTTHEFRNYAELTAILFSRRKR